MGQQTIVIYGIKKEFEGQSIEGRPIPGNATLLQPPKTTLKSN